MLSMHTIVDFSLILPCFNEAALFQGSLKHIIEALDAGAYTYEIIFVDDGSIDGTQKLIEKACKRYTFCHAIYHKTNMGGEALLWMGSKKRVLILWGISI